MKKIKINFEKGTMEVPNHAIEFFEKIITIESVKEKLINWCKIKGWRTTDLTSWLIMEFLVDTYPEMYEADDQADSSD
jgi:hypothetical protein